MAPRHATMPLPRRALPNMARVKQHLPTDHIEDPRRDVRQRLLEAGRASNGAVAPVDRLAYDADGILVLGRTKTHPESAGELASGLLKMCTIGLGKQAGAHEAHSHVLWDSVRDIPKLQLEKSKIL